MSKSKPFHNSLITEDENQSHFQLPLFSNDKYSQKPPNTRYKTEGGLSKKSPKPQIASIAGLPITHPNRYRVMLGNQILGEYLAIDEALLLAKRGKR